MKRVADGHTRMQPIDERPIVESRPHHHPPSRRGVRRTHIEVGAIVAPRNEEIGDESYFPFELDCMAVGYYFVR